jgi:hypothetical protein
MPNYPELLVANNSTDSGNLAARPQPTSTDNSQSHSDSNTPNQPPTTLLACEDHQHEEQQTDHNPEACPHPHNNHNGLPKVDEDSCKEASGEDNESQFSTCTSENTETVHRKGLEVEAHAEDSWLDSGTDSDDDQEQVSSADYSSEVPLEIDGCPGRSEGPLEAAQTNGKALHIASPATDVNNSETHSMFDID